MPRVEQDNPARPRGKGATKNQASDAAPKTQKAAHVSRKRRFRADSKDRTIKRCPEAAGLLIRKRQFSYFVREVIEKRWKDLHVQRSALEALHEAAEAFIVGYFEGIKVQLDWYCIWETNWRV
ncbi:histone H3 [Aaosphaeria arxii CBS 175.79]|uniref:Histone H3 n=1 Tax=Aaosphaeria arxii CBS 175.79 TaxID=1450172 RepID=A0A6A5XQS4_9PLEO|nr:histone H3 [Aaosphaeria arxii CBS 175.79]KAF2015187.1 histone H3 [Aaosphaeria arxii CBS 175.79]